MASDFASMVRQASQQVGAETQETAAPTSGRGQVEESGAPEGIQITRQSSEHIRGQAKSGK